MDDTTTGIILFLIILMVSTGYYMIKKENRTLSGKIDSLLKKTNNMIVGSRLLMSPDIVITLNNITPSVSTPTIYDWNSIFLKTFQEIGMPVPETIKFRLSLLYVDNSRASCGGGGIKVTIRFCNIWGSQTDDSRCSQVTSVDRGCEQSFIIPPIWGASLLREASVYESRILTIPKKCLDKNRRHGAIMFEAVKNTNTIVPGKETACGNTGDLAGRGGYNNFQVSNVRLDVLL